MDMGGPPQNMPMGGGGPGPHRGPQAPTSMASSFSGVHDM